MTTNQRRAIRLAQSVFDGRVAAGEIVDEDWVLLVMAAGLTHFKAPPGAISRKVLRDARERAGYFEASGARTPARNENRPGDRAISR